MSSILEICCGRPFAQELLEKRYHPFDAFRDSDDVDMYMGNYDLD